MFDRRGQDTEKVTTFIKCRAATHAADREAFHLDAGMGEHHSVSTGQIDGCDFAHAYSNLSRDFGFASLLRSKPGNLYPFPNLRNACREGSGMEQPFRGKFRCKIDPQYDDIGVVNDNLMQSPEL